MECTNLKVAKAAVKLSEAEKVLIFIWCCWFNIYPTTQNEYKYKTNKVNAMTFFAPLVVTHSFVLCVDHTDTLYTQVTWRKMHLPACSTPKLLVTKILEVRSHIIHSESCPWLSYKASFHTQLQSELHCPQSTGFLVHCIHFHNIWKAKDLSFFSLIII